MRPTSRSICDMNSTNRARRVACGVVSFAAALAAACTDATSLDDGYVCLGALSPAIAIKIHDARTGARAPFFDVRVVTRNGQRTDSAKRASILPLDAGRERAQFFLRLPSGTYEITVVAEGYRTLVVPAFTTVQHDRCGSLTDTLNARLTPF
jgi:hypothetical protein